MKRGTLKLSLLSVSGFIALLGAPTAAAQKPDCASVIVPQEEQISRQCGLNYQSLAAAIASAMRQNGYAISPQPAENCLQVFFDTTSLDQRDRCAALVELGFWFRPDVSRGLSPSRAPWGASYLPRFVICEKSAVVAGSKPMQTLVRNFLRDMTEQCILEEEEKRISGSR